MLAKEKIEKSEYCSLSEVIQNSFANSSEPTRKYKIFFLKLIAMLIMNYAAKRGS